MDGSGLAELAVAVDIVVDDGGLADGGEIARDPGATTLEPDPEPGSLWRLGTLGDCGEQENEQDCECVGHHVSANRIRR